MSEALLKLVMPSTHKEMKEEYNKYYSYFYQDIIGINSSIIVDIFKQYIKVLKDLSKSYNLEDIYRCAVGILSISTFGYKDHAVISGLYNRIVPQKEPHLVRFTSWCASKLYHHPNQEQAFYVNLILQRSIAWLRCRGRRERALAAAFMMKNLAKAAGNSVVGFIPQIQNASYYLLIHPSFRVADATVKAFKAVTKAMIRYRRSELDDFLKFYREYSTILISFGRFDKINITLSLLSKLIKMTPDFFVSFGRHIFDMVYNIYDSFPLLLKSSALNLFVHLSIVDATMFHEMCGDSFFDKIDEVILEFPEWTTITLKKLCTMFPGYVRNNGERFLQCPFKLLKSSYHDLALILFNKYIDMFGNFPELDEEMMRLLVHSEITENYIAFFSKIDVKILTLIPKCTIFLLYEKLQNELMEEKPFMALKQIAKLSRDMIPPENNLLNLIIKLRSSPYQKVRENVSSALFNIIDSDPSAKPLQYVMEELRRGLSDSSYLVRISILNSISESKIMYLSTPEALNYFKIFLFDEMNSVRKCAFEIMGRAFNYNPVNIAAIANNCFYNYFYILERFDSTRQRARIAGLIPYLVTASKNIAKAYTKTFLAVFKMLVNPHQDSRLGKDFVEENASIETIIGLTKTLAVYAPLDKETISEEAEYIISALCHYLDEFEKRELVLAVLHCLHSLLSPEASTPKIRAHCSTIYAACVMYLHECSSRKGRMATLKVIGAIGLIDIEAKRESRLTGLPKIIDEELARNFFDPTRDSNLVMDDTILLNPNTVETYFGVAISKVMLTILENSSLKDLHRSAAKAMVIVLRKPREHTFMYYDAFINGLLGTLETCSVADLVHYVGMLIDLITMTTSMITPFVKDVCATILKRFDDKTAHSFLDLIKALANSVRDAFCINCHDIICLLFKSLEKYKATRTSECQKILDIFELLAPYTRDQTAIISYQMAELVNCLQVHKKTRVYCLSVLASMCYRSDLMAVIGNVIRGVEQSLFNFDKECQNAALSLLVNCLKAYGNKFLFLVRPLIDELTVKGIHSRRLKEVVNAVENGDEFEVPTPKPRTVNIPDDIDMSDFSSSEDLIISKTVGLNFSEEQYLRRWLLSLTNLIITLSPRHSIRACAPVSTQNDEACLMLMKPAFLCVWDVLSDKGKNIIIKTFEQILSAKEIFQNLCHTIIDLLVFLFKVRKIENLSRKVVSATSKYGQYGFALYLNEQIYLKQESSSFKTTDTILNIYLEIGQWENAVAIYKKSPSVFSNSGEILMKLKFWDQCKAIFEEECVKTGYAKPAVFAGLIASLANLSLWKELIKYLPQFEQSSRSFKSSTAHYFAEALLHLGSWDKLSKVIGYASADSQRVNAISGLLAIYNRNYKQLDDIILSGFSLLASRPINFWAEHMKLNRDIIIAAQRLVELDEMRRWKELTENRDRSNAEKIRSFPDVWNQRLNSAPQDFKVWFDIISNRTCITNIKDDNFVKFFELNASTTSTHLHINTFNILFPEYDPNKSSFPDSDLDYICYAIAQWRNGHKKRALQMLEGLTKTNKVSYSSSLATRAKFLYASWLMETSELESTMQEAYNNLEEANNLLKDIQDRSNFLGKLVSSDRNRTFSNEHDNSPKKRRFSISSIDHRPTYKQQQADAAIVEVNRKWAYCAISLIRTSIEKSKYVTTAINCLSTILEHSPSFPDVVQLLNIFFSHANDEEIFKKTATSIKNIDAKFLLQASPQLLVQLSHQSKSVSNFVQGIIMKLLEEHYHELIFSIYVMKDSSVDMRKTAAKQLLADFANKSPRKANEVKIIQEALLRVAVTWYEKVADLLCDAIDSFDRGDFEMFIKSTENAINFTNEPTCELEQDFLENFGSRLDQIAELLPICSPENNYVVNNLHSAVNNLIKSISSHYGGYTTIDLSTVSKELVSMTNFDLAVPGTYKTNRPIVNIQYFVNSISVYSSKQAPKSIIVKGSDGNTYQYLLKGHEDLRLDERIMQFFRMVNSLMKKNSYLRSSPIQVICVIPLSISHGLIQWIPGTDTLKDVVSIYRSLHGRVLEEEFNILSELSVNYDSHQPIQKMQILENIFRNTPDTDIYQFFWLTASGSDNWLKKVHNFSVTTGINSVIGYVIGLGDRHPGNMLIDKITGKVVHIDFGDCFEKAMERSLLPEVVPFRLTRMIIRAFGVVGTKGTFRRTFVEMLSYLRDNWRVLILVLAIFVHEPLVDPQNFSNTKINLLSNIIPRSDSTTNDEMRIKVKRKILGLEYGANALSVEDHTDSLIQCATSTYNLSKMFHGWCPFW